MEQVHGQSPGLRCRRLIQSGFQQLIRLLELIRIQPLRRPRQSFRPLQALQIPQQLHLNSNSVAAQGRFMQSQLIEPISLIPQRLIRE